MNIREKTVALIDELKATCQSAGLGNDGNEFKIITQVFLYKFLNDKFGYTLKNKETRYKAQFENVSDWEGEYAKLSEDEQKRVCRVMGADCPNLYSRHLITQLWNQQSKGDFDIIFDSTMKDIAAENMEIFSTLTVANTKIPIFEPLTQYVTDDSQRAPFARALVDKLAKFSFEEAFSERYDFFANIFEYLIQDYNTAGGGKYAEYYTPHAIATIMARLLVGDDADATRFVEVIEEANNESMLTDEEKIKMCEIISKSNADYIKTSTGFSIITSFSTSTIFTSGKPTIRASTAHSATSGKVTCFYDRRGVVREIQDYYKFRLNIRIPIK